MKKIFIPILSAVAAMMFAGCAKTVSDGPNDANRRYLEAWLQINLPDAVKSGRGIYVIEESAGNGAEVTEDGFVRVDYKVTDLDGNISSYTDKETAKQLGTYDTTTYYGPQFWTTHSESIQAGLADAVIGMKVGGSKKVLVPGWLLSYKVYDNEKDYLALSSSNSDAIYEITVRDFTDDISAWQMEQIGEYFKANSDIFGNMSSADTLKLTIGGEEQSFPGMYYCRTKAPSSDSEFPSDTTIYINYTGKLLNGLVFDTTDERTAKDNGIYSSSKSYEPVQINWGDAYSDITMGSSESSVITGFALTLWQMKPMESGIGIFTSDYGYSYSGSGSSIPGYAPLIFEIEIIEKPED